MHLHTSEALSGSFPALTEASNPLSCPSDHFGPAVWWPVIQDEIGIFFLLRGKF